MLTPYHSHQPGSPRERQLLKLFRALNTEQRETLLAFARFLVQEKTPSETERIVQEPKLIPRPDQESVVKAIRRLSESYAMLSKDEMLNETATLMVQHTLHGRAAREVIDDLERLFASHYEQYRDASDDRSDT